jgi:hypothetical protein
VRLAPFASPNRGRESGSAILLLSQPPSRPVVFEEGQLNDLATTTWALKCSQPGHWVVSWSGCRVIYRSVLILRSALFQAQGCRMLGLVKANVASTGKPHLRDGSPSRTQPFLKNNAVGNLWAISYSARKTLVFDTGFNHGLTGTSTSWEAFVGFTYLLPHRLWKVQ